MSSTSQQPRDLTLPQSTLSITLWVRPNGKQTSGVAPMYLRDVTFFKEHNIKVSAKRIGGGTTTLYAEFPNLPPNEEGEHPEITTVINERAIHPVDAFADLAKQCAILLKAAADETEKD